MMDIPIPTTEQVRADYFGRLSEFHSEQFDRWLNSVKRQVWNEGYEAGFGDGGIHAWDGDFHNPYGRAK